MIEFAIFYGVGAVIFGLFFAMHEEVFATYKGRDLPCPRLIGGVLAGLVWPYAIVKYVIDGARRYVDEDDRQ